MLPTKSSLTVHAQFTRTTSTPCDNAMAWPKLFVMNSRNGRCARMMSPMMARRRSILGMHNLLSKMQTRQLPQSSNDAPPLRANTNRSSPLGRSCQSPSMTWSLIPNIWTGQNILSHSVGPTSGRYPIPWAFPTRAGSNHPQRAIQEGPHQRWECHQYPLC